MNITPRELAQRLGSTRPPRLLDVRQPEEHAHAAVPGSVLIPLGDLATRANELAGWQSEDVVVYCHHGMRSLRAIGLLRPLGFTRLINLTGGIDAWSLEVDPGVPRY